MSGRITMAWRLKLCLRGARKGKREEKKTGTVRVLMSKMTSVAALSLRFPLSPSDRSCLSQGDIVHSLGDSHEMKTVVQRLVLCCRKILWSCATESKGKMA